MPPSMDDPAEVANLKAAESGLATARSNIVSDGLQTPRELLVESAVRVSIEHYYR